MSYTPPAGDVAVVSWAGEAAYTPPAGDVAVVTWVQPGPVGRASASSPLGAALVLAYSHGEGADAHAAASSPLGFASARAIHDFTSVLGDTISTWVMDLVTPSGAVRVPISSWQATLQTGSANYAQCVVPACGAWVDAINAATEFVIYRRARLVGGGAIEHEFARAPLSTAQFDRGPQRYTCSISGYAAALVAEADPPAAYDRTLAGVRAVSAGSGAFRVRCAIDWLLRPGQRALHDGTPFIVDYINFYVQGNDMYCDVGSRAA